MWIELHNYERVHTVYMINTDNICTIYPGQTGSGEYFTRVKLANGGEILARENMKEIRELMQKGVDQ